MNKKFIAIFFQFISYKNAVILLYRKISRFIIIYAGSPCDGDTRLSSWQNRNRGYR